MAIDTRDKRASALGAWLAPLVCAPSPGVLDAADRRHLAGGYAGLRSAPPGAVGPTRIDSDIHRVGPTPTANRVHRV